MNSPPVYQHGSSWHNNCRDARRVNGLCASCRQSIAHTFKQYITSLKPAAPQYAHLLKLVR